MPESELTPERWTYAGRRVVTGGALAGVWVDGAGDELLFKCRHRSIGATYEVGVNRDATVRASVDRAAFVDAGDDPRVPGWVAEDRAAYTSDQARRREERAKRDAAQRFGELTLDDVRARLRSLPAPQRAALLANVVLHIAP